MKTKSSNNLNLIFFSLESYDQRQYERYASLCDITIQNIREFFETGDCRNLLWR